MNRKINEKEIPYPTLYRKEFEHDACGIGAVVNIEGKKSHQLVEDALTIVKNLEHRAGKDADGETSDGVGILLQISHSFFSELAKALQIDLGNEREYAIGMFFLPQDESEREEAKKNFEQLVKKEGLVFLAWRKVETKTEILGRRAKEAMPYIAQAFIKKPEHLEKGLPFERILYLVRKIFEKQQNHTYVVSLSSKTLVYKGMFLVTQLREFFPDLQNPLYDSAIALVHSRFSTNTQPSWNRAHPNRLIAHNGEINTIKGNAEKMLAREEKITSPYFFDRHEELFPIINVSGSDSAMLDNTLEFLTLNGIDLPAAVMMCIPEPWSRDALMSQEKKDFYQYYATMMEPWDGPASIIFSDGDLVGAVLDRNGLRPSRYYLTSDQQLILASEVGAVPIDPARIVKKERLHPGRMLLVDTQKGTLIGDEELKKTYANSLPYAQWLKENLLSLEAISLPEEKIDFLPEQKRKQLHKLYVYTDEQYRKLLYPMALEGNEPIAAMGEDSPLAILSKSYQPLYSFFKQMFAQVTNPPLDAIREEIVTSTSVYLGKERNILDHQAKNCKRLKIDHPILTQEDFLRLKHLKKEGFLSKIISIVYDKSDSLTKALENLMQRVDQAHQEGVSIVILSDRDIDENHIPIPSLLAVSAVHQHLIRSKKGTDISLVLESGEPREVHHFATLFGYGVLAVFPYLVYETLAQMIDCGFLKKTYVQAIQNYQHAILHGMLKVASKMGISTLQSYQGSQIFEALGLDSEFVKQHFGKTISRVGGLCLEDIEEDMRLCHQKAFDPHNSFEDFHLESIGRHKMRADAEEHLYNPKTIHTLQQAVRSGDYDLYKQYCAALKDERKTFHLRDILEVNFPEQGIDLTEVESVDSIVKRFKTGAMSYGSISQEAHETIAIAMNQLGGKSNTGEGGENKERFVIGKDGFNRCSAIKQVASGRFGVNSEYLVSAKEIQIKVAQGAKPGEGGHLPGKKVYPWVAETRNSTPGVGLISPPPHHDIYSIEDLAQLIYDLKNANHLANISVKLVSEAGVGTIAAGVAKGGAGVIVISGADGGTGAAARNSIYHAGLPWELGLAETHQTLLMNGMRDQVILETDGKLMTGRDILIAALLGAEEYGFATAPLVSLGCVMMRVCNLDTCPVGVATQNPELRKKFRGKPEYVIHFMHFVAAELREYMAKLGLRTVDELIGRTDLLKKREDLEGKAKKIELDALLAHLNPTKCIAKRTEKQTYDFALANTADESILLNKGKTCLEAKEKWEYSLEVLNINRSFGTRFGSEMTRLHGNEWEEDHIILHTKGSGGQSFGAFIPKGLTLKLEGDSNDYLGKGLSGGKIVVYPPKTFAFAAEDNIIIGNVALYGATGGQAYIRGVAGERFAVRNSGAVAVVEGTGDHACEYMTGGRVAIIGKTGKNVAAGMSGGIAYLLEEDEAVEKKLNLDMVSVQNLTAEDEVELKEMLTEHVKFTQSEKGEKILKEWREYLPCFKKIVPHDYQKMLNKIAQMKEKGLDEKEARIEAFYADAKDRASV
ncbi:glutamate synthase subunit alpha [Clostridia bacterium]|nr:glutamate synthase subunit alpha [Clostridia bacterium]